MKYKGKWSMKYIGKKGSILHLGNAPAAASRILPFKPERREH